MKSLGRWPRLWVRVILFAARRLSRHARRGSVGIVANRWERSLQLGDLDMTLVVRDAGQADGYSREELVAMLATIREQEKLLGWKVPEPEVKP